MIKNYSADASMTSYVERTFSPEDPALDEIRARQTAAGMPDIQVSRIDGLHLEVLARVAGAKRAVEVGTLGGYSGLCLLRGMPEGTLYTFEYVEEHAEVARVTFERHGVSERVRQFIGPAAERLRDIETEGPFDLAFIDADKLNYPAYLAWAGKNLRVGGLVLGDNAFLWGKVASESPSEADRPSVRAMQSFNEALARGGRFRATMLPTGEGLAMGVKIR